MSINILNPFPSNKDSKQIRPADLNSFFVVSEETHALFISLMKMGLRMHF